MARKVGTTDHKPADLSLVLATPSDILFKPLEKGSKKFLKYRTLGMREKILNWSKLKSSDYVMDSPEDLDYLVNLDPTQWKEQDHYAVIGLKGLRFRSTEDDIKKAYRLRVLKHHPDKRQGAGQFISPDGDYFACIVKAYEILGNQAKKRSYDSVDPYFDDWIPPRNVKTPTFFIVYGEWFELNSRWSNKQPVPLLGNMFTPRDRVEDFYEFWYNFDSWREYSYLDEEDKESGQFREERRWIDKQNKVARAKLKKEENSRIRTVVDNAYAGDRRIVLFKAEDHQRKLAKKQAKQVAAQEAKAVEEKLKRETEEKSRLEKEKLEAEEREKELVSKREKDALKKAMKKERKNLRALCKSFNYFSNDGKIKLENVTRMENLCESSSLQQLVELNKKLDGLGFEAAEAVFFGEIVELQSKVGTVAICETVSTPNKILIGNTSEPKEDWSHEEISLLVKAVNLFPPGTSQRWEVVANFIHQHHPIGRKRPSKQVLAKAKHLQSSDFSKSSLKIEANDRAFEVFEKTLNNQVFVETEITSKPGKENGDSPSPSQCWNTEEQKLLEQALRTFPSSHADRWTRIADCIPGRNKKECMARFKELAALIKAKKSAQNIDTK